MLRFIFACVLAVSTCGHAADTVIYYGPSGEILTSGRYTRVTISWVNGQAVMSQQVVLDVGGNIPVPPPPPPPPVDDIATKVAGLIASVTADPAKPDTSKGLAMAYGKILEFTRDSGARDAATVDLLPQEALRELVAGAVIKDVTTLRKAAEAIVDAMLADPKVGKTSTWQPFTSGMKTLAAPLDFAGVVNLYTITQGQLGGGPVPPPPPPPPPVTTAAKALILMAPEAPDQALSLLTNQLRNDPAWSPTTLILNSDAKDENKQPDPLVSKVLPRLNGPLPRLVLLDNAGEYAGDEPVPATWEATRTLLTSKGVTP